MGAEAAVASAMDVHDIGAHLRRLRMEMATTHRCAGIRASPGTLTCRTRPWLPLTQRWEVVAEWLKAMLGSSGLRSKALTRV